MEKKSFSLFFKTSLSNLKEGVVNLFIFLPYYFSVTTLFGSLFKPWKNLTSKKKSAGFSFEEWFGHLSFNATSRLIGLSLRLAIIFAFIIIQSFYLVSLPFIIVLFILALPISYMRYTLEESEEAKKIRLRESFIKAHLLKEENRGVVTQWFDHYFQTVHKDTHWWKLKNLMTVLPLARNWTAGFTPTLDQYAQDLTTTSYQSTLKSAVDREHQIEQITTTLSRNQEANVILVGESGVGKHTIIDALSKRIYDGTINPLLIYKRVLALNLEKILTEVTDQKQRETLLETLFQEAQDAGNIILFIENLDNYTVATQDKVNLTIPIEKFGKKTDTLHFIATTTPFGYQKFIFPVSELSRLFVKIDVIEVDEEKALEILLEKILLFERKNKVIVPYETAQNTIQKSEFFITNIPFPEKAIVLLDTAMSHVLQKVPGDAAPVIIMPETIDSVLEETIHVPTTLNQTLKDKLVDLEGILRSRILSQEKAIQELGSALRRSFLMLGKRKKPLANFLFLGPTGVGKTETAKALAQIFFGDGKNMLRFDMSLFQSREDIEKLTGASDIGKPGLLTQAIRETPYGVLLLDEIEKAHKDLLNIFLTIFDEGYFTDGLGKRVDCKNLIIIATSNAGSDFIFKNLTSGSGTALDSRQLMDYLIEHNFFSPEFLNRFDGVIAYQPLTSDTVHALGRRIVDRIADNFMKLYKVQVDVSDKTLDETVQKGFRVEFGARDLERVITQNLEDQVAKQILAGNIKEGQSITL